jgi:hypothetical protein
VTRAIQFSGEEIHSIFYLPLGDTHEQVCQTFSPVSDPALLIAIRAELRQGTSVNILAAKYQRYHAQYPSRVNNRVLRLSTVIPAHGGFRPGHVRFSREPGNSLPVSCATALENGTQHEDDEYNCVKF